MLNPEAVMTFIRWVLGLPEQPKAQLIPIKEKEFQEHHRHHRQRPL
ncbi:hypothetical protein SAMN02745866_03375 [Alteromonadaceae bacterium Bs31]|nr:hypothetical protein SAMN02745866_03375 [Alteromonadaceae bacterium Bs31]